MNEENQPYMYVFISIFNLVGESNSEFIFSNLVNKLFRLHVFTLIKTLDISSFV